MNSLNESGTFNAADLLDAQREAEVELAWRERALCTFARSHELLVDVGLGGAGVRQPILSCRTCASAAGVSRPVGVCDACALRCHDAHELVETGTRQLFRCDCATLPAGALAGGGCAAQPPGVPRAGLQRTASNAYGHNFEGRFCSCDAAYDAERDTMLQCQACDEWLHDVHVPGALPAACAGSGDALVCAACVARLPFLRPFASFAPGACATALAAAAAPRAGAAPGASPDDGGGGPPARVMPWRACLTCARGEDDGRGVCMHCAATGHAGHVLGPPRVSFFVCDCDELLRGAGGGASGAAGGGGGGGGGGCRCTPTLPPRGAGVDAAAAPPPPPPSAGAKRPRDEDGGRGATASPPPAPPTLPRLPARWCATAPAAAAADGAVFVPGAAMFLDDVADLFDGAGGGACACGTCVRALADARVVTWLIRDDDGVGPPAPSAAAAAGGGGAPAGGAPTGPLVDPALAVAILAAGGDAAVTALLHGPATDAGGEGAAGGASPGGGGGGGGGRGGGGGGGGGATPAAAPASRPAAAHRAAPPGFVSSEEAGLREVLRLPPAVSVPVIQGFNAFSAALRAFLADHVSRRGAGAVVTKEEIDAFTADFKRAREAEKEAEDAARRANDAL